MIRCCSFASYSSYHCSSRTLPCRLKRKTNLNCSEATLSKPQQQPAHVMMPRTIVKPLCDGNLPPILNRSEHRGSEYQFQSKLHTALIPSLSLIPSTLSSGTGKQRFTGLGLASSKARNPSRFNCVFLIREGGGWITSTANTFTAPCYCQSEKKFPSPHLSCSSPICPLRINNAESMQGVASAIATAALEKVVLIS